MFFVDFGQSIHSYLSRVVVAFRTFCNDRQGNRHASELHLLRRLLLFNITNASSKLIQILCKMSNLFCFICIYYIPLLLIKELQSPNGCNIRGRLSLVAYSWLNVMYVLNRPFVKAVLTILKALNESRAYTNSFQNE